MTLNQILYFQTVARHQHFRLAAAELSISQPSLSRSIAVLEEELGIILFERKGRTVTLTKYGKLFLEHADRILDEVRLAQKHMKKLSGNAGHVDIGYVFPLAAHYIPHTVRRFLSTQKNKDVTFNFHQSLDICTADCDRKKSYCGQYGETSADIIRHYKTLITLFGCEVF